MGFVEEQFAAYAWAIGPAFTFYILAVGVSQNHLQPEHKVALSRWLSGEKHGSWATHFCRVFDAVFGRRHLSVACALRSSVASISAVLLLYLLFSEVFQVLGGRAMEDLDVYQVLIIGALVNIVPDYISLYETRWLLRQLERTNSVLMQVLLLLFDAILSGAIIWLSVYLFHYFAGQKPPGPVEMMALFSIFSIFFYSTFLTSIWAWFYCISSWTIRICRLARLSKFTDTKNKPLEQIGAIGAALIIVLTVAVSFANRSEAGISSKFDQFLCENFDDNVCIHLVRLSGNEQETLNEIDNRLCSGGAQLSCFAAVERYFGGDFQKAINLWKKGCEAGRGNDCKHAGVIYRTGRGVEVDANAADKFLSLSCQKENADGCYEYATFKESESSVKSNISSSVDIYKSSCKYGSEAGCIYLRELYAIQRGVSHNYMQLLRSHEERCSLGDTESCLSLVGYIEQGLRVDRSDERIIQIYRSTCYNGSAVGCFQLGQSYEYGIKIEGELELAALYYRRSCEYDGELGCEDLKRVVSRGN